MMSLFMSFGAVLRELQPQAKSNSIGMMPLSCCLVQLRYTTAHMGSPKVIQLRFWLCNFVELSFLFPMMPLSCCLVQFWQSYSLHRESSHAMGNKDTGWGTKTWGREQRHGVGNPENLAGNNYTCWILPNAEDTLVHQTGLLLGDPLVCVIFHLVNN